MDTATTQRHTEMQSIEVRVSKWTDERNRHNARTCDHSREANHNRNFDNEANEEPRLGSNHEPSTFTHENEGPVFESVRSRKAKRYYVGGIASYSNRTGIIAFLNSRNIEPAAVKLINTDRGCLAAKPTLYESHCEKIERRRFWRRKMYCRRWYSETEWSSKFTQQDWTQEDDTSHTAD